MAGYACRAASWLCCVIVCLGVITIIVLANTFRPHTIAATVDSASLVNFTLSPSPAASQLLAYNLTVAVTVRNPNKHAGLYYDDVEVLAFYKGQRFGYHQLESFYQGAKTSTQLNPEFHGLQLLQGGDVVDAAEFRSQQANGSFAIDVGLNANLRVKVLSSKVSGYKANITCKLLVPAPGATNNGATFMPTDCQASLVEPPESPSVQFSGRISIVGAQT